MEGGMIQPGENRSLEENQQNPKECYFVQAPKILYRLVQDRLG